MKYIIYRGQKIPVTVESTFNDGKMSNVKAVEGFPFYSSDVQSQGDTFGAWNCNGYRVRSEFVLIGWNSEPEGTSPSPYISGGEVMYNDGYKSNLQEDDYPF